MLELDIIKLHVRLEPDFSEDDQLLETYSNAARRVIEGRTGARCMKPTTPFRQKGMSTRWSSMTTSPPRCCC
ncbi:head-tail connector protein [Cobetia marina]